MTTYRLFRCNLCGDYLQPSDNASKAGFGVHFTSTSTSGAFVFKNVSETERHICVQCAKSVHDEMRKVTPAERKVA